MRYVVIGASASAINGVREIRKNDKEAKITLVSKDDKIYSRCILHNYLSDTRTVEQLNFAEPDFETRYNVEWIKNNGANKLIQAENKVILQDGTVVSYDKLLIATGSRPNFPPIPNINELSNIYGFRNLDDVEKIKEKAKTSKNIVVLGAGLVGLDVIVGLCEMGIKNITLVEFENRLLSKQLDQYSSETYETILKEHGVKLMFNKGCTCVNGNDKGEVSSITVTGDEEIPCDMLVVTIGVKSNVEFLEGSGVALDKFGIITDKYCGTNVENIYAAGDVTGKGPIWPVAVKEGIVAGSNMTGNKMVMDDFFYSKSTMNFFGINTMSIGVNTKPDDSYIEEIVNENNVYKKIIHKDGVIVGAILQGDLSYGGILTRLVSKKINISNVEKSIFKIDYSDFFNLDVHGEYFYKI